MPLSEQEQRLLEEMERNLYHNDADFVAAVSQDRTRPSYSAVVTGILVAVGGLAVLLFGVIIRQPIVGVLGFAIMFTGVMLSVTPRRRKVPIGSAPAGKAKKPQAKAGFMQNLGDRWEKRQDDHDAQ